MDGRVNEERLEEGIWLRALGDGLTYVIEFGAGGR